jgi:glutamate--cysteine ligase
VGRSVSIPVGPLDLLAALRTEAFSSRGGAERVGVEVELLPVELETGRVAPIEGAVPTAMLPFLRRHGVTRGWRETKSTAGVPTFALPGGGAVSFEPGGQVEYSSPPMGSVDAVVERLDAVIAPLVDSAREMGVAFVARGFDPTGPAAEVRPQLQAKRYARMCAHYDRRGPWGRRMMCQSAAIHVNVDWGEGNLPWGRWRVANAAASVWTAIFANSTRDQGSETGHRSVRALQWRHLDPSRCGLVAHEADPATAYLRFALGADAFLLGPEDAPARPMEAWVHMGCVDMAAWVLHLTTLFPEVRPRGYLELRPFDALRPCWYAAPLVLSVGLLYDAEALLTALEILPSPTSESLERSGRLGLRDEDLARLARDVAALSLEGAERLGPRVGGRSLEIARAFVTEFTNRGKDPADEPGDFA